MKKMFHRIDRVVLVFAVFLFSLGCGRASTIPDDDLVGIFRDIYVANAFQTIHYRYVDTLDFYTPILDNYGYDIDDFNATMLGFTKRKNSKLLLIIEAAIRRIDREFYNLEDKIAVLDTIAIRSQRRLEEVLIDNRRIEVSRIKDTTKLMIEMDVKPGSYFVSYISDVDSLDGNRFHKGTHILKDSLGKNLHEVRCVFGSERKLHSTEIVVGKDAAKLVLNLGNYGAKMKKPSLVIDSLNIIYHLPRELAVDSMNKIFTAKIFRNETNWSHYPQDSISLHLPTSGVSSESSDNSK